MVGSTGLDYGGVYRLRLLGSTGLDYGGVYRLRLWWSIQA